MQKQLFWGVLAITLLFLAPHALAQASFQDVCCFGVKKAGDGKFIPFAGPKKRSECTSGKGGFRPGQQICGFIEDPDNVKCPTFGGNLQAICEKCGYNWLADLSTCSEKSLKELVPKEEEETKKKDSGD